MGLQPGKVWKCDGEACKAETLQVGEDASAPVPVPPVEWAVVDVIKTLPPAVVGEGVNKTKVGVRRETTRWVFCPACRAKYVDAMVRRGQPV